MQPFSDENIATYLSWNADFEWDMYDAVKTIEILRKNVETYKRARDIINDRLKLVTGYSYHDQDKVDVAKHKNIYKNNK